MKAAVLQEPGVPENLKIVEIAKPDLQDTEVLVKVKAISINPVDVKTRSGKALYGQLKNENPIIVGWDIAGEVTAVGKEVKQFKPGDAVFGMVNFPGHGKAYAEYVAAPASHLALKPNDITYQEAAATTLAALTAWQVLVHIAGIKAGQKIFIQAAAGGVGHYAVQIAKHFGAYTIGTASMANASFLQEIGLDEHIDYINQDFTERAPDVDLFFDTLGAESVAKGINIVKDNGQVISILGGCNEEIQKKVEAAGIRTANYLVQSSGADMAQLAQLLESGHVKAHVSHQFDFENIADAHRQVETGKTRGKVVLNLP